MTTLVDLLCFKLVIESSSSNKKILPIAFFTKGLLNEMTEIPSFEPDKCSKVTSF